MKHGLTERNFRRTLAHHGQSEEKNVHAENRAGAGPMNFPNVPPAPPPAGSAGVAPGVAAGGETPPQSAAKTTALRVSGKTWQSRMRAGGLAG